MESRKPEFRLTRNGISLVSVPIDRRDDTHASHRVVEETLCCGFELEPREPDLEYRVQIGDLNPEGARDLPLQNSSIAIGRGRGSRIEWDDSLHLESARGRVVVRLTSRRIGTDDPWQYRGRLMLNVLPSKLTESRYRSMFEQLNRLASGLVFDLVSKGLGAIQFSKYRNRDFVRSNQLELRALVHLWVGLSSALREIDRDPWLVLRNRLELLPTWGGERMNGRSLASLASRGLDPRSPAAPRPFPAIRERLTESVDTFEHRCIAGLLRTLRTRTKDCRESVRHHIESIERDRDFRSWQYTMGPSLYDVFDLPRIRKLKEADALAAKLEGQISAAMRLPFLHGVRPIYSVPSSPVFRHVQSYRRVRRAIAEYITSAPLVLDEGLDERIKSTHRMYEQWVFLQIASAFRTTGLTCETHTGFIQKSGARRFTLDIERGTSLKFRSVDRRSVTVTYEPWILPEALARQQGHPVFRGRSGESAWSPDILIEFRDADQSAHPGSLMYAIVVDAKYSKNIGEHHWQRVTKYLEIRATDTGRQVVRQLWLAHPGTSDGITCDDTTVIWGPSGPNCPHDEVIKGVISLLPPEQLRDDSPEGEEDRPVPTALTFASGLLAYLGISAPPIPEDREGEKYHQRETELSVSR